MPVENEYHASRSQSETLDDAHAWADQAFDFVLVAESKPPSRIELARERMLICRLYLGLMRTITDDYGAEFAAHSDSLAYRTIGIYVFLRTVMCSPVRASQIAHALKLPRVAVLRRLQEMVKHGYVERVGNAYRVTDKVNIPDLQKKLQRRIDLVTETAKRLSDWGLRVR
jgi:DNA-binding MarR family transcriptional regulator